MIDALFQDSLFLLGKVSQAHSEARDSTLGPSKDQRQLIGITLSEHVYILKTAFRLEYWNMVNMCYNTFELHSSAISPLTGDMLVCKLITLVASELVLSKQAQITLSISKMLSEGKPCTCNATNHTEFKLIAELLISCFSVL